jgi:dihydrofolate synthase/folylpolyglutamate synthase
MQLQNAAGVLALLEALGLEALLRPEHVNRALGSLRLPGRMQVVEDEQRWLFDVAHNPAGATSLAVALDQIPLPTPIVGLIGILGDKPWGEMLGPLLRRLDRAVFTVPPSAPAERAWNPAAARSTFADDDIEVLTRFPDALDRALELAGSGTVLVTGSNHTVGDALREIEAITRRG